jgi:DNA-cytosine methyltransferase
MRVLSLFNGMGCAWLALDMAGIAVSKRYSCEIDKHANIINDKNYSDTIQLGDVTKIKGSDLGHIDLLVGGSPCQGFSMNGKMLNFDDPRSMLFFEYVRILNELREINPNIKFMLENVVMKGWCKDVISRYLGVYPVLINSSLFTAQNRERLYWCNWSVNMNIRDRGIYIKDILEKEVDEKYFVSEKAHISIKRRDGKYCRIFDINKSYDKRKAMCLTKEMPHNINGSYILVDNKLRILTPIEFERLQGVKDRYTEGVSDSQRYGMLGNGWTVPVIAHIFEGLKKSDKKPINTYNLEFDFS